LPKTRFFRHNLGTRYARKPIKGSKDSDHNLVSKKTSAKNGSLGWRPGQGKLGKKGKNMPALIVTSPTKNKTKLFC